MRKELSLKSSQRFSEIFEGSRGWADKNLVLKALPNYCSETHVGIVASKKVGNAVVRNTIKRRLREIVSNSSLKDGWDIVLIARPQRQKASFQQLYSSVNHLLRRSGLSNYGNSEKKPCI